MKIIVVGCGKVGKNIAEELVKEKHDIVLVDSDMRTVNELSSSIDVLGVVGNGASVSTLKEAGVENADMLIAITDADEINMLTCLFARKVNKKCKTIARVRNPIYNDEINYIRDELGLTMIINPEMIAAREMAKLIRWPSALRVDSFSKGKFEFIGFAVDDNQNLVDKSIKDIMAIYRYAVLFVGIERGDETIIPDGNTIIKKDDKITIASTPEIASLFLEKVGIYRSPIKNCMIAGGSKIAYYLATYLIKNRINITIIDKDMKRCKELADALPEASIIHGLASDGKLLLEEGLEDMDCFCSLTGVDEENILLSMYAKTVSDMKVITKVNHISYKGVVNKLDVGALISPKNTTASYIVSFVRAISNAGGNDVETMHRILDGNAEVLSFRIKEKSKVVGVPFETLDIIDNTLVCSIIRNNKVITPSGKDTIEINDIVLIISTHLGMARIEEILKEHE